MRKLFFFIVFLPVMLQAVEEKFQYTPDNFFASGSPTIRWREGLGLGSGPLSVNLPKQLWNYRIAGRFLATVEPNYSIFDSVYMDIQFDWALIPQEPNVSQDIENLSLSIGPCLKLGMIPHLGGLILYAGPIIGVGIYLDYPDLAKDWYVNKSPMFGIVGGVKSGVELFLSDMLSVSAEVRFMAGRYVNNNYSGSPMWQAYGSMPEDLRTLDFGFNIHMYFGQDLFWFLGFHEKN